MNTKFKIALGVVAILIPLTVAYSVVSSEAAIMDRFPEIPNEILLKAHRKMVLDALRGKHAELDTDDDIVMDAVFLNYVHALGYNPYK